MGGNFRQYCLKYPPNFDKRGALAEQFVGQELLAYMPDYLPGELFYWQREKTGSLAEIDYVINIDSHIIPIEVKAGKTGTLRHYSPFYVKKKRLLASDCH